MCHQKLGVLAGNALTGPIPDLTSWTNVFDLLLARNEFTGTIPTSILQLPAAIRIDLVRFYDTILLAQQLTYAKFGVCFAES